MVNLQLAIKFNFSYVVFSSLNVVDHKWLLEFESPNVQPAPDILIYKILGGPTVEEGLLIGSLLYCVKFERYIHYFDLFNIHSFNLILSPRCNHSLRTF